MKKSCCIKCGTAYEGVHPEDVLCGPCTEYAADIAYGYPFRNEDPVIEALGIEFNETMAKHWANT